MGWEGDKLSQMEEEEQELMFEALRSDHQGNPWAEEKDAKDNESTGGGLASSTTLVCFDTQDETICGATIGTSGKFCTMLWGKCQIKAHARAKSYLRTVKLDGIQEAIFIRAPKSLSTGARAGQTSAFKEPFLDTKMLDLSKKHELLQLRKLVPMWSMIFAMLEEEAHSLGIETTFTVSLENLHNKALVAATTPAKRSQPDKVQAASPLPLQLIPFPDGASNREGISILWTNQNVLAQQCRTYAEELIRQMARYKELTKVINGMADKVNVLAGLVGVPAVDTKVPSLWQAVNLLDHKISADSPSSSRASYSTKTREEEDDEGLDDDLPGSPVSEPADQRGEEELRERLRELEAAFATNVRQQRLYLQDVSGMPATTLTALLRKLETQVSEIAQRLLTAEQTRQTVLQELRGI